jgi:hypothetical protein
VYKLDFRIIMNWKPNKWRPLEKNIDAAIEPLFDSTYSFSLPDWSDNNGLVLRCQGRSCSRQSRTVYNTCFDSERSRLRGPRTVSLFNSHTLYFNVTNGVIEREVRQLLRRLWWQGSEGVQSSAVAIKCWPWALRSSGGEFRQTDTSVCCSGTALT